MQRPATIRHRTSLFEEATSIVEGEFASDLSLDDIARRVASSRRQLQRAYAEIGNTTFREHLTGVRMDRAAEMLGMRGLTVREVATRRAMSSRARSSAYSRSTIATASSNRLRRSRVVVGRCTGIELWPPRWRIPRLHLCNARVANCDIRCKRHRQV
jgi:AraC family transcriptional regulator of adaptative response / methylphosphotriester-DNA alkyltransferase methyltransferase